jgi:hypothetical protein
LASAQVSLDLGEIPGRLDLGFKGFRGGVLTAAARRAVERDEQAIARWVAEDWP